MPGRGPGDLSQSESIKRVMFFGCRSISHCPLFFRCPLCHREEGQVALLFVKSKLHNLLNLAKSPAKNISPIFGAVFSIPPFPYIFT